MESSVRFWTAAALCRFLTRRDFQKRQRAAAVQNASAVRLARIFHQTDELNFAAAKVGKEMPMTV